MLNLRGCNQFASAIFSESITILSSTLKVSCGAGHSRSWRRRGFAAASGAAVSQRDEHRDLETTQPRRAAARAKTHESSQNKNKDAARGLTQLP